MDEEKLHIEGNIAWLRQASPDDWHRVALDFNWGEPIEPLFWIVRQPECDRATALTVFWRGEPGSLYLSHDDDPAGEQAMLKFIAERINAGGYARAQIAFDATPLMIGDYESFLTWEKATGRVPFRAHPDMKRSIRGREVRPDAAFYRRYPADLHHGVLVELPGELDTSLPDMKEARFEAAWLVANLTIIGCGTVYLADYGLSGAGRAVVWIAAIAGLGWCARSALTSLGLIRGLLRGNDLRLSPVWLASVAGGALLLGAGLGLLWRRVLLGRVESLAADYGTLSVAALSVVFVLPLLWLTAWPFARGLINGRAVREI